MTYVMSDLHGCYDKYIRMLMHILFTEKDTLYILGDVIDRGDDGIRILQDAMNRPNVHILRGNHEQMAMKALLSCLNDEREENADTVEAYALWMYNGGHPTVSAFCELDTDAQSALLQYMHAMPVRKSITVGGQKFFLAHTVPEKEKFASGHVTYQDLLWGHPDYDKVYRRDTLIVTGHTPTFAVSQESRGRIYKANNHIDIDCGAVFGNPLGCLCLDTMEEFYVE